MAHATSEGLNSNIQHIVAHVLHHATWHIASELACCPLQTEVRDLTEWHAEENRNVLARCQTIDVCVDIIEACSVVHKWAGEGSTSVAGEQSMSLHIGKYVR